VTGEKTTHEELGGSVTHATRTGVASFLTDDESSCFDEVRYLLSFLPPLTANTKSVSAGE
jgi:acetyl-CoA carboxylase carboxyltransferase component